MKQPLEWHRQYLENAETNLSSEQTRLKLLEIQVDQMRAVADFRRMQIAEAERRGMDSFDADKLLVRRK